MIDLIKSTVRDKQLIDHFRNHHLLEWKSNTDTFNLHDPEVVRVKVERQYKGIRFAFHNDRLDIVFLPHYYYNNNIHNSNDFTAEKCILVLLEFKELFQVDLKDFPVCNLEYGINILSPISITDLLSYLYCHDRNVFHNDVDLAFSKRSSTYNKEGKMNKYKIVKGYAKALRPLGFAHPDTFRFEVKSHERKFIKELSILTMDDLLSLDIYSKLGESIIKEFDSILIIDGTVDISKVPTAVKRKLELYSNPNQWYKILQDNRNRFSREKKRYMNLLDKTGDHLKKRLNRIVQDKVYSLTAAGF